MDDKNKQSKFSKFLTTGALSLGLALGMAQVAGAEPVVKGECQLAAEFFQGNPEMCVKANSATAEAIYNKVANDTKVKYKTAKGVYEEYAIELSGVYDAARLFLYDKIGVDNSHIVWKELAKLYEMDMAWGRSNLRSAKNELDKI
jgi:hypothetical protein